MPTDHFESETQALLSQASQAAEDRQALNVRREGFMLLESLIGRAKLLERALSADDIAAVARLLDRSVGV